MKPCESKMCDICPGDGTYSHESGSTKIVATEVPLFLEEDGTKRQVGTAKPVLDKDGHLIGFDGDITDERLIGSVQPKPNPLCRLAPFSIGKDGLETS